jgi:hypothetical protein
VTAANGPSGPGEGRISHCRQPGHAERGSAVVEFTFLALLFMVPLGYIVITVVLSNPADN